MDIALRMVRCSECQLEQTTEVCISIHKSDLTDGTISPRDDAQSREIRRKVMTGDPNKPQDPNKPHPSDPKPGR